MKMNLWEMFLAAGTVDIALQSSCRLDHLYPQEKQAAGDTAHNIQAG